MRNDVASVTAVVSSNLNRLAAHLAADPQTPGHRWQTVPAAVIIIAVAFTARLYPMLRGGGLYGLGNYDDGVYYAAAAMLTEGRLPYRDYLLLQPPGIAILLAPFAAIGSILGDPIGLLVGRLAWMALGAANALLVGLLLLPVSRRAALLGGATYAVFFPAVYSEHTVLLKAPATTALLISLLLCRPTGRSPRPGLVRLALAGAILGAAASIKIWGVVPVLVMVVWLTPLPTRRPGLSGCCGCCVRRHLPAVLVRPNVADGCHRPAWPWRVQHPAVGANHRHRRIVAVGQRVPSSVRCSRAGDRRGLHRGHADLRADPAVRSAPSRLGRHAPADPNMVPPLFGVGRGTGGLGHRWERTC